MSSGSTGQTGDSLCVRADNGCFRVEITENDIIGRLILLRMRGFPPFASALQGQLFVPVRLLNSCGKYSGNDFRNPQLFVTSMNAPAMNALAMNALGARVCLLGDLVACMASSGVILHVTSTENSR